MPLVSLYTPWKYQKTRGRIVRGKLVLKYIKKKKRGEIEGKRLCMYLSKSITHNTLNGKNIAKNFLRHSIRIWRKARERESDEFWENPIQFRVFLKLLFSFSIFWILNICVLPKLFMVENFWQIFLIFYLHFADCYLTGHEPESLLKMPLFQRCFSNILLLKTKYLVSTYVEHWLKMG